MSTHDERRPKERASERPIQKWYFVCKMRAQAFYCGLHRYFLVFESNQNKNQAKQSDVPKPVRVKEQRVRIVYVK